MGESLISPGDKWTMSDIEDLCQMPDLQIASDTEHQLSSSTDSTDSTSEDEDYHGEGSERHLQGIAEISQQLLEELTMLEAKCDAEEARREQDEVCAAQVSENRQQWSRPRIMSELHEVLQDEQEHSDLNTDTSKEYYQQIADLQETIRKLMEDKQEITGEKEELNRQILMLQEEVEDQRLDRKILSLKLERSERKFLKLNRVSLAVSQECTGMVNQLETEQNLRHQAELYAHKMLSEQKAACRQSMILMQNVEPSEMLVKALEDIRSLTTTLEETKQELQTKVESLELQLSERPSQEQLLVLQEDLHTANMEMRRLEEQLQAEKEKCAVLEERVKRMEEELKGNEAPCSTQKDITVAPSLPPPPPPLPPPCLTSKTPEDPLALLKQRRRLPGLDGPTDTAHADVRADAVRKMMESIKSGVILRPAKKPGQNRSAVTKKRESIINELHGMLMDTMRKPARKASRRKFSRKVKDSELDFVLQRRRLMVDIPLQADSTTETEKHTEERDGADPSDDMRCKEDSPSVIKRRLKTPNLQKSRRNRLGTGQILWQ
ncbi:shootin-1-like isoform X2 [Pseudophryne corroboree]|uniref:shootin-1-like isoform X2 n=1 Tax=Pseudophryne corroboree TaxID=495146 RepID=UPI003081C4D0